MSRYQTKIIKYPFDAVYYINLASRVDRRMHVESILKELAFHETVPLVERVDAVDGKTVSIEDLYSRGQVTKQAFDRYKSIPLAEKFYGMDITDGALGCALSHRAVWQKIITRKHKCALVLEDDVELSPEFQHTIAARFSSVPCDWQLLYLGGVDLLSSGKPPRPLVAKGWRRAYMGQRELSAYVCNESGAKACLDLTKCLNWQIDTHICEVTHPDFDKSRPYDEISRNTRSHKGQTFQPDSHSAMDRYITKPMSYAAHPTLAIQLSKFGTNVQKLSETATGDAFAIDAKRRIREFYSGLTSVR
uniref:Glycosyl transferase family 25 domain-containing protein n=1 Tax=Paramoeba aestuarina TaxID=180227 RepID=A0A7S4P3U5_9EUKA|mmetsp:Transcript_3575/g.5392  ORF Transcript_3575/g.5392 Transcript_3575/m.5392 type:complete len:304 (+) Transcript_3575:58-969(+)